MKNAIECFALEWPEDNMHMVGHHAPRMERVAFSVEVLQVLDDDVCKLRVS